MGSSPSKTSFPKTQQDSPGFSNLTLPGQLPQHTIQQSKVSVRESRIYEAHLKPDSPRYHLKVSNSKCHSERPYPQSSSPHSLNNTECTPLIRVINEDDEIRGSNLSGDSLRETHLNENTKKSTLKDKVQNPSKNIYKSYMPSAKQQILDRNSVTRSAVNPQININFSGQSTKKSLHRHLDGQNFSTGNKLLVLPPNLEEIQTIQMSQQTQSYQILKSNRSYEKGNGLLIGSQRSLIEGVEDQEVYRKRGYFILTETNIGEKRLSDSTAAPGEQGSDKFTEESGIFQWIAMKICGAKEQRPEKEILIEQGCNCEFFKSFRRQNNQN